MVRRAAQSGLRCVCFNTAVGDAAALHIGHHNSSSCVSFGRRIPLLPGMRSAGGGFAPGIGSDSAAAVASYAGAATDAFAAARAAESAALDACFCAPVAQLVEAVSRDYLRGLIAETAERSRLAKAPLAHLDSADDEVEALAAMRRREAMLFGGGFGGGFGGRDRVESSVARALRSAPWPDLLY